MRLHLEQMIIQVLILFCLVNPGSGKDLGLTNTSQSRFVKLRSVDIDDVQWTGGFWGKRFELTHKRMIPYTRMIYMERAYQNFRIAAGLEEGEFWGKWWHDGDFYKWLETAAYVFAFTRDADLDRQMDEIIEVIGKAQADDGYITTAIQIGHGATIGPYTGERLFSNKERWARSGDHELYNFGHLLTAACVHHRTTGKKSFLNIARKAADHLYAVFHEPSPDLADLPWNPPHLMGLVELYRTTREKKYLELAQIFLDMRGTAAHGTDQNQKRTPFREETEAVGHAVTANYLYAGIADIYAETGEKALWETLDKLWHNVTYQKMSITGGTGALHRGVSSAGDLVWEAYGREYELPNASVYNETCANIGNAMWNWRMLNLSGAARFADVMELVFYNSGISGLGISGLDFFYTNVLRWHGQQHRVLSNDAVRRWSLPRGGLCCPPNLVRTNAQINAYAYGLSERKVWIHLFGHNVLDTELSDGSRIKLTQETEYPWDGDIKITVKKAPSNVMSLMLRIPGWTKEAQVKVNGRIVDQEVLPEQYFEVQRKWSAGDIVELDLAMPVRLLEGHPLVEQVRGQVAFKRGPIVYCLESYDLPAGINVSDVVIPSDISVSAHYRERVLDGVTVLEGEAYAVQRKAEWSEKLYRALDIGTRKKINIKLVPYYAWNNRYDSESSAGIPQMSVWLPIDL
jgi:DUF1680 family protein